MLYMCVTYIHTYIYIYIYYVYTVFVIVTFIVFEVRPTKMLVFMGRTYLNASLLDHSNGATVFLWFPLKQKQLYPRNKP